jgi:tetratricopeptide (TPR) repeat protein
MKVALMIAVASCVCFAQAPASKPVAQTSHGPCSPNISNVSGVVKIQFASNACSGIDPEAVRRLNAFLTDFPKTQHRLQELLDKKDVELSETVRQASEWATKYQDLSKRLTDQPADDDLSKRAAALLKDGQLDQAAKLLDEILAHDEMRVDQAARNSFNRAQAYELQYQPVKALLLYEKAYRYRPGEFSYAFAYAKLLQHQNRYMECEPVYNAALALVRVLSKSNPAAHLPDLALALNNLGNLYATTQRLKESEAAYEEALGIRRQLAKANPAADLPDVAATLNNLGILYRYTQRFKDAEAAYQESLKIYRQISKDEPAPRLPDIARTLSNLGSLYQDTQRLNEAEAAYQESLRTYRQLAKGNGSLFLPHRPSDSR